jgi:RNA polymerase sigma-70 factor (ECF subfamily)
MTSAEQLSIFTDWMEQHQGLIFKAVRAYAYERSDQEDLFQEITTKLWESIPNFKRESAATTWIYRVALFCAMSWKRKEKRHRESKRELDDAAPDFAISQEKPDPRLQWLYEQIGQLAVIDRSLTLLMLDGYSYREMADILGITESNIGVKINRIKKHLTKQSQQKEHLNHGL